MRVRHLQSNMTSGELSPEMWSRVDVSVYNNGVSKAENVVIMPHGGLRRRPGLTKCYDSYIPSDGRLFSFEFSISQDYLVVLIPGKIRIYHDGHFKAELTSPFSTLEQVKEVDAAQSGDVMIFTHNNHKPQILRREGSDTSWALFDVPFVTIPTYDFGTGDEPVWSDTRGWPGVVTFFQSRLWFAGSTQKPSSIWGSQINDYYDFDIGDGQADYGLFDTLDTEQFNKIINLYAGRNLLVFTTGSEFYNTAEFITPSASAWKRGTSYGSKRIRPVMIDGAVYFTDRIGRTVRESVFEFQEDSYVAPSISLLSNHLITQVQSMDAVKGTNIDISDFLYIINEDGTCAVMNTLRLAKIQGWTQWTTQGSFLDVCVVNKVVYFLVERHGEFCLEYMNEGTTLDHNSVIWGTPAIINNVIHSNNNVVHRTNSNVVFTKPGSGQEITQINTRESITQAAQVHKIKLDNSMMEDQLGGVITLPRPSFQAEVGFDVPLNVDTMILNLPTQVGNTMNAVKRVIKVNLNLKDTLGVYVNKKSAPDRTFAVVLDSAPEPFTGLKEVYLLGYDKQTIVEVHQTAPLPFELLGVEAIQEIS